MNEIGVVLGDTRTVVGVITEPDRGTAPRGLGCLLLNAGSIHRVGPQRLHVRLARRLASLGVTTLRFDFSGIGDSPLRPDNMPFADAALVEARSALDMLQATRGIDRFVAIGICWGADNALRLCSLDPRLIGAGLIDPYFVLSLRHWFRLYGGRLFSVRSWVHLLRGESSVLQHGAAVVQETARAVLSPDRPPAIGDSVMPIRRARDVVADMRALVERGVDLCCVFTRGSASWDHYHSTFRRPLLQLAASGHVQVKFMPAADHLFTLQSCQATLLDGLVDWVRGIDVAELPAGRNPDRRVVEVRVP